MVLWAAQPIVAFCFAGIFVCILQTQIIAKCMKERPEMRVKEIVRHLAEPPFRQNTLKTQRKRLGLSRAALARILEVDPSSVYRQELRNPMSMLWNYALRGIKAEAQDSELRAEVRDHKAELARRDKLLGPSRLDACNFRLTAEKMRAATREHATAANERPRKRRRSPPPTFERPAGTRVPHALPRSAIDAAVDRAITRSEAMKK
jgi:hypothetical protein